VQIQNSKPAQVADLARYRTRELISKDDTGLTVCVSSLGLDPLFERPLRLRETTVEIQHL